MYWTVPEHTIDGDYWLEATIAQGIRGDGHPATGMNFPKYAKECVMVPRKDASIQFNQFRTTYKDYHEATVKMTATLRAAKTAGSTQ